MSEEIAPIQLEPKLIRLLQYSSAPAPTCPLYTFLINRQFFEEASAAWLRSRSIECHYNFDGIVTASRVLKANLWRFTTTWGQIWGPYMTFDVLRTCTNLRELHMHIGDHVFDDVDNKMCYRDSYVDEDYQAIWRLDQVLAIPALERVKFLPVKSDMAKTDEEQEIWKKNVFAFEAYINRTVKHLRETTQPGTMQQALQRSVDRALQLLPPFFTPAGASLPSFDKLVTDPLHLARTFPAPPALPPLPTSRMAPTLPTAATRPAPKRSSLAEAPELDTQLGPALARLANVRLPSSTNNSAQAPPVDAHLLAENRLARGSVIIMISAASLILTFVNTIVLLMIICSMPS